MKPVKNLSSATVIAAPTGTPRAGQLIGDRYRLDRPLERGAMGSVWRAEQVRLRAPVAVKFLDPSLIGDKEMHDRFIQEARSAAAVRSAHVVQVFDYGSDGGVPYIAMELLDGENLDARLGSRGTLTPGELDRLFMELARGIGQAHAIGVIHRDLKPGNIFIAREGEHEVTKIVDFGIAKVKASALRLTQGIGTQLGTLLGTPQYMSPEQVRGSGSIDHRTDLWALAVIACECLTGRCPFSGATIGDLTVQICTERPPAPSSLGPVPPGFDQWFFKATQKKPNKRFQNVEEMAERLHAVLAPAALAGAGGARAGRLITFPSRSEVRLAYSAVVTWKGYMVARLGETWVQLRELMQQVVARLVVEWELARQRVRDLVNSDRLAFLRPLVERHGMLASVALLCCGILLLGLTTRSVDGDADATPAQTAAASGPAPAALEAEATPLADGHRADGRAAPVEHNPISERHALQPTTEAPAAAAAATGTAGGDIAIANTAVANTAVEAMPAAVNQPIVAAMDDAPEAAAPPAAAPSVAEPPAQRSEPPSETHVRVAPVAPAAPAKAAVATAQPAAKKPKPITKAMAQAAAKILTADDLVASVPPAAKKPAQRTPAPRPRVNRPANGKSSSHPFDDRL